MPQADKWIPQISSNSLPSLSDFTASFYPRHYNLAGYFQNPQQKLVALQCLAHVGMQVCLPCLPLTKGVPRRSLECRSGTRLCSSLALLCDLRKVT